MPDTPPEEYLRQADPVLGEVIDEVVAEGDETRPKLPPDPRNPPDPNLPTDRYGVLLRAIVSQNISERASTAIWLRLIDRYGGRPPTPEEILEDDPDRMR